jgi:HPt (histidine-containing phosphotransfer) domain-containing protein
MSAKLQSLIATYATTLPAKVQSLAQCLAPSTDSGGRIFSNLPDALEQVHRIKGGAGSLGFGAVSRAAEELELLLKAANHTHAPNGESYRGVSESLAQLQALALAIKPEGSRLYGVDLSQLLKQM